MILAGGFFIVYLLAFYLLCVNNEEIEIDGVMYPAIGIHIPRALSMAAIFWLTYMFTYGSWQPLLANLL